MKVLPNAFVAVLLTALAVFNAFQPDTVSHLAAAAYAFVAGLNASDVITYMVRHRF